MNPGAREIFAGLPQDQHEFLRDVFLDGLVDDQPDHPWPDEDAVFAYVGGTASERQLADVQQALIHSESFRRELIETVSLIVQVDAETSAPVRGVTAEPEDETGSWWDFLRNPWSGWVMAGVMAATVAFMTFGGHREPGAPGSVISSLTLTPLEPDRGSVQGAAVEVGAAGTFRIVLRLPGTPPTGTRLRVDILPGLDGEPFHRVTVNASDPEFLLDTSPLPRGQLVLRVTYLDSAGLPADTDELYQLLQLP